MKKRIFTVLIEKDEDSGFIAEVPALKSCYTQGDTIEEVLKNIKEAIELCLEVEKDVKVPQFVGIQQIEVA